MSKMTREQKIDVYMHIRIPRIKVTVSVKGSGRDDLDLGFLGKICLISVSINTTASIEIGGAQVIFDINESLALRGGSAEGRFFSRGFDPIVLSYLLASASAPLTLAVDQKEEYDDADMKVSLFGQRRLRAVGKTLDRDIVDAESIGLMVFREDGPRIFRDALEDAAA